MEPGYPEQSERVAAPMTVAAAHATDLSSGQLAARCGVAVSAIHFYERKGLINSWRTARNERRYPREVLRRVAFIKVAQGAGISLTTIRDALMSLPQERTPTAEDWSALSLRWREELDARITRLTRLRDEFSTFVP